jgi:hypothetical protein
MSLREFFNHYRTRSSHERREPPSARLTHFVIGGVITTMRANGTSISLKRVALLVLFFATAGSPVQAQTSQGATPNLETLLKPGTTDVAKVRVRRSDSVLNGALIGAGAAVASGLLLCRLTEPWENCRDDVGPMLTIGAIGAGAGIGIDALIRGRTTIYAAPIIARDTTGLRVSLSF